MARGFLCRTRRREIISDNRNFVLHHPFVSINSPPSAVSQLLLFVPASNISCVAEPGLEHFIFFRFTTQNDYHHERTNGIEEW